MSGINPWLYLPKRIEHKVPCPRTEWSYNDTSSSKNKRTRTYSLSLSVCLGKKQEYLLTNYQFLMKRMQKSSQAKQLI